MTPTTHPSQILDRSVLTTRYQAARAAGNDPRATAILEVLSYLDDRSRAGDTPTRWRPYSAMADQVDTLLRLYWWWAAPVLTPAQQSSRPITGRPRQRCGGAPIRTHDDARPAGSREHVPASAA